jgi:hypothetical protein
MKITLSVLLLIALGHLANTQADGNPHGWDRRRRCDGEDYAIPCGLCEGYGGIPYGDEPNDITLTRCEPIANASEINISSLAMPYYPEEFTHTGFYEVLIGQKSNPLCVGAFPGPDSTGPLCYQPQQGTFHYDWKNYQLRIDYTQKSFLKNTSLTTYHKKGDMWIVIDYNLLHQCICTQVGRKYNITLYPVNPRFMQNNSRYIGREKLYIEYLWVERVVDHWVKGPHHVWVDVDTGLIIRMWQPFNGLEVFDPTKWNFSVDPTLFDQPPQLCKKGGALWRIMCDDDGYYKPSTTSSFLAN